MIVTGILAIIKNLNQYRLGNRRIFSGFALAITACWLELFLRSLYCCLFGLISTDLLHSWAIRPHQQPQVADCCLRGMREHSGSGITHHLTYLLAVVRLVAMHRTFGTDWLLRHERADFQPLVRVRLQLTAFLAQPFFLPVHIPAVQSKHEGDCFFLGVQNLLFIHEGTILTHLQRIAPGKSEQVRFFLSIRIETTKPIPLRVRSPRRQAPVKPGNPIWLLPQFRGTCQPISRVRLPCSPGGCG